MPDKGEQRKVNIPDTYLEKKKIHENMSKAAVSFGEKKMSKKNSVLRQISGLLYTTLTNQLYAYALENN